MSALELRARHEAQAGAGLAALAEHLRQHAARDAALLGLSRLPDPGPFLIPVIGADEDECRARVDAFARANGTEAGPHAGTGTYRAVVRFGTVDYIAFTRTLAGLDETAGTRLAGHTEDAIRHIKDISAVAVTVAQQRKAS